MGRRAPGRGGPAARRVPPFAWPLLLAAWTAACAPRPPAPAARPVGSEAAPAAPPRPLPAPDAEAIYFVMVDRFANGDPANDVAVDPADPQAWHGGDLQGVLEHLDHVQSLGFTTIWLSPLAPTRTRKFHGHGAFHGYWVHGPGGVDPRYGGPEALAALSAEMRRRGMRLVLDVVTNHVAFDAPLLAEHPGWFHPPRPIRDWEDPEEVVTGQVHGLPDLAQEREPVYRWLRDATLPLVTRFGASGLRLDAVRHLPTAFLARLAGDLHAAAGPDLTLLGELFEGDPLRLARTWRATGLDAMFDFPLHYALLDVACRGAHPGRLAAVLGLDRLQPDPRHLVTFLDNHDLPRVATACGGVEGARAALELLFLLRGTPCVTWGTEAALPGAGEPDNRADMPWDAPWPLAPTLREGLALRRAHPALARGDTRVEALDGKALLLSRVADGEAAWVAWNGGQAPRRWRLPGGEVLVAPPGRAAVAFGPASAVSREAVGPVPVELRGPPGARAAGSAPELGGWDPAAAPAFGPDGRLVVPLPPGTVVAWKPAYPEVGGGWRWDPGPDRYRLAGPAP